MNTQDEALLISNPRLITAVYFGLLAIIATYLIQSIFYLLGIVQLIPTFKAIVLAVVVAAAFGALFGERIIHSPEPYGKHVFFWAFLMVLVALPVYNIGLVYMFSTHQPTLFTNATLADLIYLYFVILLYNFIFFGIWLGVLAGFAALYLRSYVVYYLSQGLSDRPKFRE